MYELDDSKGQQSSSHLRMLSTAAMNSRLLAQDTATEAKLCNLLPATRIQHEVFVCEFAHKEKMMVA